MKLIGLFLAMVALAVGAVAFAPTAQAVPATPPECAAMTFTQTIVVTSPSATIVSGGTLLVFGRPNQSNNISVPLASQVCLVGGTANDMLSTGGGADIIIGNGYSGNNRDYLNGKGGTDTCYGPGNLVSCEVQP